MATGFLIGASILGIGSSGYQYAQGKKAAKKTKALDAENLELYKQEVEETVARTEEQQRLTEGNIEANIGASGFAVGGSLDKYLDSVKEGHTDDIDWMRTSGASRQAIMEREADARYSASRAMGTANLISGLGSSIGLAGQAAATYKQYGWGF